MQMYVRQRGTVECQYRSQDRHDGLHVDRHTGSSFCCVQPVRVASRLGRHVAEHPSLRRRWRGPSPKRPPPSFSRRSAAWRAPLIGSGPLRGARRAKRSRSGSTPAGPKSSPCRGALAPTIWPEAGVKEPPRGSWYLPKPKQCSRRHERVVSVSGLARCLRGQAGPLSMSVGNIREGVHHDRPLGNVR